MASKDVMERGIEAAKFAASAESHGAETGQALATLLQSHLHAGESFPDVALLLNLAARALAAEAKSLGERDAALEKLLEPMVAVPPPPGPQALVERLSHLLAGQPRGP